MDKPTKSNERTDNIIPLATAQKPELKPKTAALDKAERGERVPLNAGTPWNDARDTVLAELCNLPDLYRLGPGWIRIDDATGTVRPIENATHMRVTIGEAVSSYRMDKNGEQVPAEPSKTWAEGALFNAPIVPGMRSLKAIHDGPILAAIDGKLCVLARPGFHELRASNGTAEGVYIKPHTVAVQHGAMRSVTADDARQAVQTLLRPVQSFPWQDNADKGAWIALILTMLGRELYDGPTPAWIVQANARGAGKSLLATIACVIVTGDVPTMRSMADDDETRKQLLAAAMVGTNVIVWDNAKVRIGGAAIEGQITATKVSGRKLGESTEVAIPWRPVHVLTANGASTTEDMAQRAVNIRLRTTGERRRDIEFPDVRAYIAAHRAELFNAACTILAAWWQARARGETADCTPWGSFPEWRNTVARACVYADLPDVKQTQSDLHTEHEATRAEALNALYGWQSSGQPWGAKALRDSVRINAGLAASLQPLVSPDDEERGRSSAASWSTHTLNRVLAELATHSTVTPIERDGGGRLVMTHTKRSGAPVYRIELRR